MLWSSRAENAYLSGGYFESCHCAPHLESCGSQSYGVSSSVRTVHSQPKLYGCFSASGSSETESSFKVSPSRQYRSVIFLSVDPGIQRFAENPLGSNAKCVVSMTRRPPS